MAASAAYDDDSVFCEEAEGALVVVIEVLVGEGDVVGVCVGEGWEEKRMGRHLVPCLGRGEKPVRSVLEKGRGVGGNNAGKATDAFETQEQLWRGRDSLEVSSVACLESKR